MPVVEAAGIFATIVALFSEYKSHSDRNAAQQHQTFIEWLEYHRHEDLKNLICNNATLHNEVNGLIQADTKTIIAKIEELNKAFASFASQFSEFRGLASSIVTAESQNPEAMALLRILVKADTRKFLIQDLPEKKRRIYAIDGSSPRVEIDMRFVEDDLEALSEWGFLRKDYNSQGKPVYSLTRQAVRFVEASESS